MTCRYMGMTTKKIIFILWNFLNNTIIIFVFNSLLIKRHRNYTAGNTVFFAKNFSKSLQVKKLRIMFVYESNNPFENNNQQDRIARDNTHMLVLKNYDE